MVLTKTQGRTRSLSSLTATGKALGTVLMLTTITRGRQFFRAPQPVIAPCIKQLCNVLKTTWLHFQFWLMTALEKICLSVPSFLSPGLHWSKGVIVFFQKISPTYCEEYFLRLLEQLTSALNFVVSTVLVKYCVYYKI